MSNDFPPNIDLPRELSADGEAHTPMLLRVRHLTRFTYADLARDSCNDVRLCPITDGCQKMHSFRLRVQPPVLVMTYHDFCFNRVDHFEIPEPHSTMEVESVAVVETYRDNRGAVPVDLPIEALSGPDATENFYDFLSDTPFVSLEPEIWREAVDVLPEGVRHLWFDSVKIGEHIYKTFRYLPRSTNAHTRMVEVLRTREGVCQDFAHVMLAMCRSQGIPARYASGYFYNKNRQLDEIEASHAWVEIFLPGYGWKGYDPTHCRLADTRYIKLAVGRDYADIRPVNGTFRGRGTLSMTVEVRITRESSP